MVVGGSAVMSGCTNLLAAIRAAAADRLGFPNEVVTIADGVVTAGAKQAALSDFVGIGTDGSFATTIRTYGYGAHAGHVAVAIRARAAWRFSTTSPSRASAASPICASCPAKRSVPWFRDTRRRVLEHLVDDKDAQILNASLADYMVPLASDFANVRAITMELRRSKTNPPAAKGAGEGGMVAVAATAANCSCGRPQAARCRAAGAGVVARDGLENNSCWDRPVTQEVLG